MGDYATTNWQERIVRQVRGEPKRAAALTVLIVVMGVMWGRAVLTGKSTPSRASANVVKAAGEAAAGPAVNSQLSRALQELQDWKRAPVGLIHRNLFAVRLEYFPQDGSKPQSSGEEEGFWDQLAKSLVAKADQEEAKRILAQNVKAQAARLELQSTMMSQGSPKAMINGTLIGEGETIGGFRVLQIESKRIVVEREGVKLEILFKFQ
jgi:hypothetical protein